MVLYQCGSVAVRHSYEGCPHALSALSSALARLHPRPLLQSLALALALALAHTRPTVKSPYYNNDILYITTDTP